MAKFLLSEVQTQAILDMRLSRLTNLEVTKLQQELAFARSKSNFVLLTTTSNWKLI